MKKMFLVLTSILSAVTCFGATNWSKSVQMDQNYVLLNRSNIVLSNTLAVAAGDLTSTTSASTVVGLRGKSIPLPGAGDGGKAYVYNSGLGVFELQAIVGATPTLAQVTAAGSNTTANVKFGGSSYFVAAVEDAGTTNTFGLYAKSATFGNNVAHFSGRMGTREHSGTCNIMAGWNAGIQRFDNPSIGCLMYGYVYTNGQQVMDNAYGSFASGNIFGFQGTYGKGNWQHAAGYDYSDRQYIAADGAFNWAYFNGANQFQTNTANGSWAVGRNNLVTHNNAYCFGVGVNSVDTNAHHAQQYFVQSRIMPFASNTVDIGSAALPFRSVNASNFNVVGSSITFNGTLAFTMTNGNAVVVHQTLQNPDGSPIGGSTSLFSGSGTTGLVTSAGGDAGKFLRADGTWQASGGSTTRSTVTSTTNYTVIVAESSKQLVMDSSSDRTFNLPSVGAGDVGTYYTFVKVNSGRLTIDAADSDTIADSGAGDTIYDSQAAETYATLTLILATETKWVISGAHGTWTTTTH